MVSVDVNDDVQLNVLGSGVDILGTKWTLSTMLTIYLRLTRGIWAVSGCNGSISGGRTQELCEQAGEQQRLPGCVALSSAVQQRLPGCAALSSAVQQSEYLSLVCR